MASCSYNDDYTIVCDNGSIIRKLSNYEIDHLHIDEIIGIGSLSVVYNGYLGDALVAIKIIKHTNLSRSQLKSFDIEVCNQNRASEYHLAPRILGYWVCPHEHIFIMDYINGLLFKDVIHRTDFYEIFVELIRRVVYQNQVLGIIHGDLHDNNIFVTQDRIIFIDYGFSTSYPETHLLSERLSQGDDISEWTTDLVQCGRLLSQFNLNQTQTWNNIYSRFFYEFARIPDYNEVADIIRDLIIVHLNLKVEVEDYDYEDF